MLKLIVDNDFPPRNLESDTDIIYYIAEHQVPRLYPQGYEWFWLVYMPALNRVVETGTVDAETLADNFYTVGDVHETNGACEAAIKAYKRALTLDPFMDSAHHEISCMYERLERYPEAIYHNDLALKLNPFDANSIAQRENLEFGKDIPLEFSKSELASAKACEALARQNPQGAIDVLRGFDDVICLRTLTWAHGANLDVSAYFSTWKILIQKIRDLQVTKNFQSQRPGILDFKLGDIFFMPENIYSGHEIWGMWKDSGLEFTGFFTEFESLEADRNYLKLSLTEKFMVKIQFYYFENSDDLEGLKTLHAKFPQWTDVTKAIKKLEDINHHDQSGR